MRLGRTRLEIVELPVVGGFILAAAFAACRSSGPPQPTTGIDTAAGAARRSSGGQLEFLGQRQRLRLIVGVRLLAQLSIHQILLDELSILTGGQYANLAS